MKKLLLTLLLLFSLGMAAKAETWSYTVVKGSYTNHDFSKVNIGTKSDITFNKKVWQILIEAIDTSANPTISNDGNSPVGIVIGAATKPPKSITLFSGQNFDGYVINKVSIKVAGGAAKADYNAALKVGSFSDNATTKVSGSTATEFSWTPNTEGEIEITFTNNLSTVGKSKNAGLKICSISVEYSEATGPKEFNPGFEKDYTIEIDKTYALVLAENAPKINYTSSNENIASVVDNEILALGVGSATITATWDEVADTWKAGSTEFTVTVTNPALKDANLSFDKTTYDAETYSEFNAPRVNNPNNLTVKYSSSNETVATVDASTGAVTLVSPGVTVITATSNPTEEFNSGEANYTLNVAKGTPRANNIAEMQALAPNKNDKVIINCPLTVTYVNGNSVYVTDGKDYTLVYTYDSSSKESFNPGLNKFDVIPAGWTATYSPFNGLPEFVPTEMLPAATETGTFTPRKVSLADVDAAMLNEVVIIQDVTFETATPDSNGSNFNGTNGSYELAFRNNFKIASVDASVYDVETAVAIYKEDIQVYPIEYTPVENALFGTATVTFKHFKGAGRVGVDYNFKIANYNDEEISYSVEVTLDGKPVDVTEYIKPETSVPAKAAGNTSVISGTKYYENTKLKNDGVVKVNFKATIGDKELVNDTQEISASNTTGIEDVTVEGTDAAEYYNLQGLRVSRPEAGQLYIKRQGGKAVKVRF